MDTNKVSNLFSYLRNKYGKESVLTTEILGIYS